MILSFGCITLCNMFISYWWLWLFACLLLVYFSRNGLVWNWSKPFSLFFIYSLCWGSFLFNFLQFTKRLNTPMALMMLCPVTTIGHIHSVSNSMLCQYRNNFCPISMCSIFLLLCLFWVWLLSEWLKEGIGLCCSNKFLGTWLKRWRKLIKFTLSCLGVFFWCWYFFQCLRLSSASVFSWATSIR